MSRCRLRKSSSPSRWLMGLPPASPRFKYVHMPHAGGGSGNGSPAIPRRPPRQQLPSPSVRSRSLELLDQDEEERKSSISAVVQARPPLPRPRSRSLDGLLDEDVKSSGGESCEQDKQQQREKSRSHVTRNSGEEGQVCCVAASEATESQQKDSNGVQIVTSENDPVPVPRTKPNAAEFTPEDTRTSSNDQAESEKETLPTRPPKPSRRFSSSEEQFSTTSGKQREEEEKEERRMGQMKMTQERLQMTNDENENNDDDDNDHDDRSIMLKTRSCGAGLDSDGSASSSEYSRSGRPKDPGSLLSLPTGAEPKRKRNFMDKCVNKVRSFIKK